MYAYFLKICIKSIKFNIETVEMLFVFVGWFLKQHLLRMWRVIFSVDIGTQVKYKALFTS